MEFSMIASFLKMLLALAMVLGLMILSAYALKRIMSSGSATMESGEAIKILTTHYLGPKHSIHLIEVADEVLVVGMSGGQMTLLSKITEREHIEKINRMKRVQKPIGPADFSIRDYRRRASNWLEEAKTKWGK